MSNVIAVDTTKNAKASPEKAQPWKELGLKEDEYARIREILGRRPTSAELAMYSVMWSEHCSYKSSKIYLRQFGEKVTDEMREHLMVGMGENAGVVDIGEGWAVTFKVESHNHPSYIEPFQGAATGVGGIVRDILTMGARPIAVMDQLRFGDVSHPDTARVVHGVVSGISFYGNCLGLPNIGGETVFDKVYQGNPLVKAAMRRFARRLLQKQMMDAVPTADVIVANPTHFAVALRYERGTDAAPVIVAKGENRHALRIKELGAQHGVPIVENRPVARLLYATGKVGEPIPQDMFEAVAEILAFVYRTYRYYYFTLPSRRAAAPSN